jgi:hypothetical protein
MSIGNAKPGSDDAHKEHSHVRSRFFFLARR